MSQHRSLVRFRRGERRIWQRRYWEHQIRYDEDFRLHTDYVYVSPLKHGLAQRVRDWPYSSFHRDVRAEFYPLDWAGGVEWVVASDNAVKRITPRMD